MILDDLRNINTEHSACAALYHLSTQCMLRPVRSGIYISFNMYICICISVNIITAYLCPGDHPWPNGSLVTLQHLLLELFSALFSLETLQNSYDRGCNILNHPASRLPKNVFQMSGMDQCDKTAAYYCF